MGNSVQAHNPIKEELNEVEMALKSIGKNITATSTQDIFDHFFRIPGKYLRPTLVLLCANAINPCLTIRQKEQLIHLSVAVELIHSASLIHDDIIDGDLFRRGQETLNNIYKRKIAVLAGDTLYAKAFSILSNYLPRELEQIITQVIEKMCVAEIDQAREREMSQQNYFGIIEGKTALFMSACCKLGAVLTAGGNEDISALGDYGLNFGMVYQIIDDCIDNDPNASNNVTIENAKQFAEKAMASIETLKPTEYKQGLINLLDYILSFSQAVTKKSK